jgi:[ribosomal protein S5]-alanine N-acetyltransferase
VSISLPLESERLTIRSFLPDADARPMLRIYGDPEVMRYIPGGALPDEEAIRKLLRGYASAQEQLGFSSWAVVERKAGRLIGDAGFGVFEPTGEIELGYTLARDRWGYGYAEEAARACLVAGLEHLQVPRIIAVVDAENESSRRVAKRIGMTQVETIRAHGRPHVVFAAESQ